MAEVVHLKCPFCKEGDISVLRTPETYGSQTIRVGSNRKTIPKLTPGKDEVVSEACPVCGKKKKEIQQALRGSKSISAAELAKRLQESGLPTRI